MTEVTAYGLIVLALGIAGYAGWHTVIRRRFSDALFYAIAFLEVLLVAQLIVGCFALANTDRHVDGVTFVAYLVTAVLVPVAAVLWGISDHSRWGTGVVLIGMVTIAALCLRMLEIWSGHYA